MRGDSESSEDEFKAFSRNLEAVPDRSHQAHAARVVAAYARRFGAQEGPGTHRDPEDTSTGARDCSPAISRHLEAGRDSLTDGCAARILGEGTGGSEESGERTSQGQIEMVLDD